MKLDVTPPGPRRWERAALNAVRRPNTRAAKLYYARVTNARLVADALPKSADGPYQFMEFKPSDHDFRNPGFHFKYARQYAACSTYCMVMIAQLRACPTNEQQTALPNLSKVHAFINGELYRWNWDKPITPHQSKYLNVITLDTTTLTRDLHCFCCGVTIKKGR